MNLKNFITFEGGECSGKTTIINEIIKEFEKDNIPYITLYIEDNAGNYQIVTKEV